MQQSNTVVVIHDAFQPISYWQGFMPKPTYEGVILDTHIYQMFSVAVCMIFHHDEARHLLICVTTSQENQRSDAEHIKDACSRADVLASSSLPVVVGEWTPGATDCAKYLNGRGVGSRYEGTHPDSTYAIGSCVGKTGEASTFSSSYKTFLRQYWEAQTSSFEKGCRGWIQWTWKAEIADEWSYQAGLANGWIPQDPTARMYPNICG
ncbi:hypothetical protein H0H81_007862 [Sphagnurus paluster]|uniref:Uncharacterized protein n=1 Tax=Sphagnurus paluster TaxID=117069 RepID=A0A9P7GKF9_9AGAR|nr:hypothetical protein H0H81_007862 [Sphagnurus paluster]